MKKFLDIGDKMVTMDKTRCNKLSIDFCIVKIWFYLLTVHSLGYSSEKCNFSKKFRDEIIKSEDITVFARYHGTILIYAKAVIFSTKLFKSHPMAQHNLKMMFRNLLQNFKNNELMYLFHF